MKFLALVILSVVISVQSAKYLTEKPPQLHNCLLDDANFKKCYALNFQVLFQEWRDGVPGLKNLGPLDPLFVKRVRLTQNGNNDFSLSAELTDLKIQGASKTIVQEASLNLPKLLATIKFKLPKMIFDGNFKMKGRILNFDLNGNGKAHFEADNVVMIGRIGMKARDEFGLTFTDLESVKINIADIGDFRIHLDNLFGGQKVLEDSINEVFNQNWRDYYELLRPAIAETIEAVTLDRFKKIFAYVPASFFIADFPSAQYLMGKI